MQQPYVTLNNSVQMPQLGFGAWQLKDGPEAEVAIGAAISTGYRMIDTAAIYGNEQSVGKAIVDSGVSRHDIFVTTKLWNHDQGYASTFDAFEKSRQRLGLDYIDLYLIHWPVPKQGKYIESWRAFEDLYADGKVRAIGVSNFTPDHLEQLMDRTAVTPAVNQIEVHPHNTQQQTRDFCVRQGIAVESYSPLGGADSHLFSEPVLRTIADTHSKSIAQVIIRWHIQNDLIVIPKSARPERITENFDVFDFELTPVEMTAITSLDPDLE